MLQPERALEVVTDLMQSHPGAVQVVWCRQDGDRHAFCERIVGLRGTLPIFPLPLRGEGFDDPNSVAEDVVRLVEKHRAVFEAFDWNRASNAAIGILIVSRGPLFLPQGSSPAAFPAWFPRVGGQVVPVLVADVETVAEVRLDAPETRIGEIRAGIYALESALLGRLASTQHQGHGFDALGALILAGEEKAHGVLAEARRYLDSISDPRGYRPSLKLPVSITARLLRLVAGCTPDQLPHRAKALMAALSLPDSAILRVPESVPALLCRSTNPIDARDHQLRFGCNLLQTLFAAHSLSTAVAHAGDYPRYPLALLQATSFTILTTLRELERAISLAAALHADA
ncbi:MAG TPA: hypothetical protein VFR37_02435 [Longimicrobium sp.]|nr:hypothetical protein [Longimicrobium sp.]